MLADEIGNWLLAGTTEYTVSSKANEITAGPAGALRFTEASGNMVGRRITLGGAVTEYALPGANTAGPDGAVWFTEFLGTQVGRITGAGAVVEYAIRPVTNSRARVTLAANQ